MANRIVNSTVGQGVFRGDGIRLYGLDAELELKQQSKRDPEYENELGKWIEQAVGLKLEFPDDLIESLRSGIVLCTLINVLLPGTINKINTRPLPLMQIENIGLYLKACWKVGIPSSDLFVTSDLYQRKGVQAVLQNIASVARSSHTCPDYNGPKFGLKPPSQPLAKKWDEIKFSAPVTVADLEKNSPIQSPHCDSCGKMKSCSICEQQQQQQQQPKADSPQVQLLSNQVREQESKVKEKEAKVRDQELQIEKLTKSINSQKEQYELNENQFKSQINSQLDQIKSKEKQIQNLTSTISSASRGSTLVNSNIVSPSPTNSSISNTSNNVRPITLAVPSSKEQNRFSVKMENISCQKCNFLNSKVSKYCISCGSDIKKDISNGTTESPSTSSNSLTKLRSATVVNSSNTSTSTNSNNNNELNDKIQLLCNTIKEQEDSISKLNKQVRLDSESFDKRIKEQKQIIDNQQILLNQRDFDLKKLDDENKKIKTSSVSVSNTPSYITHSKHNQQQPQQTQTQPDSNEIILNNQNNSQPNRISFSVSGYRSKQVGPSSYIPNNNNTNNNTNNNNNQNSVWLPPLPKGTKNITNTTNTITNGNGSGKNEVEELKAMIKMLESKLSEEVTKNRVKDSTIKVLEDKLSTIQTRPTRKQALANSQVVVGRKRFTTLRPDGLEPRLVETTLSHINDILFSRPIEFHQVSSLNALFKTEEGRRRFSQILQQSLKHLPTLCLSDSSFEFMLFLLNTILQEMDYSKDHNDFITAKVIFASSDILYRVNERTNEKDYLKSYIKVGLVWKKVEFWEDMFYNLMAKKHRNIQGGTMERVDRDIVRNLLSYLGVNMIQFNLTFDEVSKFINEMATLNQVPQTDLANILTSIKNQDQIQNIVNNQKLNLQQPLKPDLSIKSSKKENTKKEKKK